MKRKQFDITIDLRLERNKSLQLTYTIVMIDSKIVRIFNHTHSKKGFLIHHAISPTSDMYLHIKENYEELYANS